MALDEVPERLVICARILDAWPNARPANRDRTLVEYLNATRGVPLARLGRCVQLAIDAGGEFMPPAGEVVRRAAVQALGGAPIGKDPETLFWHQKRVAATVRTYHDLGQRVLPLNPDAQIGAGDAPQIDAARVALLPETADGAPF